MNLCIQADLYVLIISEADKKHLFLVLLFYGLQSQKIKYSYSNYSAETP